MDKRSELRSTSGVYSVLTNANYRFLTEEVFLPGRPVHEGPQGINYRISKQLLES